MRRNRRTAALSSDGHFIHCSSQSNNSLTISLCCSCGEYVCAAVSDQLLSVAEQCHQCPGKLFALAVDLNQKSA